MWAAAFTAAHNNSVRLAALGRIVLVLSLVVLLVLSILMLLILSVLLIFVLILVLHDEAHLTSTDSMPPEEANM